MSKKLTITFLLTFLFFCQSLVAQNKFSIGLVASPSIGFLFGNEKFTSKGHKPGIGYSSGVSLHYRLKKSFSLITDVQWERKVNFYSGINDYVDNNSVKHYKYQSKTNLDYLVINLLASKYIGEKQRFFANIGIFVGYFLHGTSIYKENRPYPYKFVNEVTFSSIDAGFSAGFGYVIPIQEKFLISFECRNNIGFVNIGSTNNKVFTNSNQLLFSFLYKFGISKN